MDVYVDLELTISFQCPICNEGVIVLHYEEWGDDLAIDRNKQPYCKSCDTTFKTPIEIDFRARVES